MNDKELLELAAKAAGVDGLIKGTADGAVWLFRDDNGSPWNPLTDDGDALRLAVKLRLLVDCYRPLPDSLALEEGSGLDACANTRRAIVKSAAEIGRKM